MTTRDEFSELLYDYGCRYARGYHGYESERILAAGKEAALLAVYDEMAARIAELEKINAMFFRMGEGILERVEDSLHVAYDAQAAQVAELVHDKAALVISNDARRISLRNCEANETALAKDLQGAYARVAELEAAVARLGPSCAALLKRAEDAEEKLADWDDLLKHAMDGRDDEVHCACCAPLRAHVEEMERELRRYIELSEDYDDYN